MSLSENLQNLRKMKNMSQEELAEKLEVSRQAVSKWESGNGYPETEKIISICEIFDCSMDELVKGKISNDIKSERDEYDSIMKKVAKGITSGIFLILVGVSILLTLLGFAKTHEQEDQFAMIGVCAVLTAVTMAVPLFIINGTRKEDFKKKYPQIANIYTEKEIAEGKDKHTKIIAAGVGTILLGVVVMIAIIASNCFGEDSVLPVAILMYFVTIGATTLVYAGQLTEMYNLEEYNKVSTPEEKKKEDLVSKICGVIMLTATAAYLVTGFVWGLWGITWFVFPVGGIMCGIVGTILK